MKTSIILLLCLAIYGPQVLAAEKPNADRPNIVLIFADDLGWADVGYQASDFYETPNLDALAKQGMVFTAAYAAAGYLDNPVIRGRDIDVRTGFRSRPVSVINKAGWKLHLYHEEWQLDGGRDKLASNNAVELYNLTDDIGEQNNLANANPVKRDELLADLFAWFKSADALVPTKINPQYDPLARSNANNRGAKEKKKQ